MRLMIVDDERTTRETLSKLIDWSKLGIKHVELASDGQEALEKAKNTPTDILLTDVRMPLKDGMKLADEFSSLYPGCKILFLSGYSDKDYLFSAIKLRANAYIEKPIDPEQLAKAVETAVNELNQDRKKRTLDKERQEMLRQDFVRKLLSGDIGLSEKNAQKAGIHCERKKWHAESAYLTETSDRAVLLDALNKYKTSSDILTCEEGRFIHLLAMDMINGQKKHLSNIANDIDSKFYIGTASGFGGLMAGNRALNDSIEAALNAYYFGKGSVDFDDIVENENRKYDAPAIPDSLICYPHDTELMITDTCNQLRDSEGLPRSYAKDALYKIALKIVSEAKLYRVPFSPLSGETKNLWQWVDQWETLHDACKALIDVFNLIVCKTDKCTHIRRSIGFIEQRLDDYNLSISMVAAHLGLNQSYFCTLFRKEMNETFGQYITRRRMIKAKSLLAETNTHIKDVARLVGYVDVAWFIKRFKQTYDMTPSEFKERYG